MKSVAYVVFIAALVLAPGLLSAHNLGASHEEMVGEYLVDIGYDPASPVEDDRLLLDLNLWDAKKVESIDFSSVWVRIENESGTLLATGVHKAEFGATTVLFRIPEGVTNVDVSVRFERGTDSLAEVKFLIPIGSNDSWYERWSGALYALFGLLFGVGGALYTSRFLKGDNARIA